MLPPLANGRMLPPPLPIRASVVRRRAEQEEDNREYRGDEDNGDEDDGDIDMDTDDKFVQLARSYSRIGRLRFRLG